MRVLEAYHDRSATVLAPSVKAIPENQAVHPGTYPVHRAHSIPTPAEIRQSESVCVPENALE